LNALPEAEGAIWNMGRVCIEGTRVVIRERILNWSKDLKQGPFLWLTGTAGSGKSTISNSVAMSLSNDQRVMGYFAFDRGRRGLNDPELVVTTIARQLSSYAQLNTQIMEAVKIHSSIASHPFRNQLKHLIHDPVDAADIPDPVVIILDALDESGGQRQKEFVDALSQWLSDESFPSFVKILITSRYEPELKTAFESLATPLRADQQDADVVGDIRKYIEHRITAIRRSHDLPLSWPGVADTENLVRLSAGLFQWATVACNFLEEPGRDPKVQLYELLKPGNAATAEKRLDSIYIAVLENAYSVQSSDAMKEHRYIVGSIITAKDPLSLAALDGLLGLNEGTLQFPLMFSDNATIQLTSSKPLLSRLGSILLLNSVTGDGRDVIRVLHPSLIDFFIGVERCGPEYHIDPVFQHKILLDRCISVMRGLLQQNICRANGVSVSNSDLKNRVEKYVPEQLQYACRFWVAHLREISRKDDDTPTIISNIKNFLFQHLLHWVEVMVLLEAADEIVYLLQSISEWVKVC
jgi:hypothetical protein